MTSSTTFVHDHGPTEGRGLDCPEHEIGGRLVGTCLLTGLAVLSGPLATVKVDPRRQHVALLTDETTTAGAFVDLGPELHWWSHHALHLDPAGARDLGAALIEWADRRRP